MKHTGLVRINTVESKQGGFEYLETINTIHSKLKTERQSLTTVVLDTLVVPDSSLT